MGLEWHHAADKQGPGELTYIDPSIRRTARRCPFFLHQVYNTGQHTLRFIQATELAIIGLAGQMGRLTPAIVLVVMLWQALGRACKLETDTLCEGSCCPIAIASSRKCL